MGWVYAIAYGDMSARSLLTRLLPAPVLLGALLLAASALRAQSEADYIRTIAAHWGAETEVAVASGRVDILTDAYAIEVERASKWKNAIGQSLWYGLQKDRAAGIVLLVTQPSEYKYFLQLNSALAHGGLAGRIRVWQYPADFPGVTLGERPYAAAGSAKTAYWLSTNSRKRHNATCRWYEASKGRYCSATEGTLAGCCD